MSSVDFNTRIFEALLKDAGITDYETEYKFHPTRKWRFDYAIPEQKIAYELEGGIYQYSRHNRASGFIKDCEKYNEAALLGWKVFRIPTIWLTNNIDLIQKVMVIPDDPIIQDW